MWCVCVVGHRIKTDFGEHLLFQYCIAGKFGESANQGEDRQNFKSPMFLA